MKYKKLGNTDINVSLICLGTMTWGEQNTEAEAHQQLDYAIETGINFIDTAEMYPIPVVDIKKQGLTEKYIGTWLKNRKDREQLIIATKAAGPGDFSQHIRKGPKFTKNHLVKALHDSLRRLQTDYVDLYQMHWPERATNYFGKLGYVHQNDDAITDFQEVLEVLQGFIQEGKIRCIGISNETPWGMMKYLEHSAKCNLPKIVSIQNPYNLVNRNYEIGLSEMGIREKVGLLAYSPLAGGLLSGKYFGEENSEEGSRYNKWSSSLTLISRYSHINTKSAIEAYIKLASKYGINLSQMSLAYVHSRDFLTSTIIGATKMSHLKDNIKSVDVELDDDLLKEIETIHLQYPNPAP